MRVRSRCSGARRSCAVLSKVARSVTACSSRRSSTRFTDAASASNSSLAPATGSRGPYRVHGAPSRLDGGDLEFRPALGRHAIEGPVGHVAGDALEVGVGDHVDGPESAPALDAQVDLIGDARHAAARELLLEALEL